MKKIIAVICILFLCCIFVKAEVKEVKKFSKKVDELSSSVDTFLEYAPKVNKTLGIVGNFKININTTRKNIPYGVKDITTKEDFKKVYDFLEQLEAKGDLTFVEAGTLPILQIQIESTTKRLISDFIYLFAVASDLKKEYPNYSKRKIISAKLKKIYKKFLKAGGLTIPPDDEKEIMKHY